jgi:hypothetical protein
MGEELNNDEIIADAQEVIEGEIWTITTRSLGLSTIIYVLETTCEVIGYLPSPLSQDQSLLTMKTLRADWSEYVVERLNQKDFQPPSLMERLVWTNHEEYERGISKLWLKTVSKDVELGIAKRLIAQRYILACVVANRWAVSFISNAVLLWLFIESSQYQWEVDVVYRNGTKFRWPSNPP